MRMLLRPEFLNGPFGDPALYIWEINEKEALLFDCGDLSRFSTRELLRVSSIFLSHCHIDHFADFDLFLRVHVGTDQCVTVYGPPDVSLRLGGKLQGYTWNLISDQKLEFIAVELDMASHSKRITHFHARDQFRPTKQHVEHWNPAEPVLDSGTFQIHSVQLDHSTPSMAYSIEEKVTVHVNSKGIGELRLKPGAWMGELKHWFLSGGSPDAQIKVIDRSGAVISMNAAELASKLLLPRPRHKIAYATDGAAQPENRKKLLNLIQGADEFYSETCFLEADRELADGTKHFTAKFIAELAQEAQVKMLIPFHFSKRYLDSPELVLQEIKKCFKGDLGLLTAAPRQMRL